MRSLLNAKWIADNVYTQYNYDTHDIDNQTNTSNYTYTAVGNLRSDVKDSATIKWNVYGKISEIQRYGSTARPVTNIKYSYDAAGNRIGKRVVRYPDNVNMWTWYVRNAAGNVMATYYGSGANSNNPIPSNFTLLLKEQHIYGSSRIGVLNREVNMKAAFANPTITVFERGNKNYEQVNHLGNVLATISDKKLQHVSGSTVDYYEADLVTANDYYPGGMIMPGRKFTQNNSYRYGFNGKENDSEVKGDGNAYDFGARIHDPRLGRWLSVDQLQQKYTDLSPYQYCANSPISAKDPDGRLIIFINGLWTPGTGVNQPFEPYWGKNWIAEAQDRMGDHAQPRYYDGSLGGMPALIAHKGATNNSELRESQGKNIGYQDAFTIIQNLKPGETIKIVTNSMGTAFARGFTKGILKYQAEELAKIDDQLGELKGDNLVLGMSIKTKANPIPQIQPLYTGAEQKALAQISANNTKISQLEKRKSQLLNVHFESETDLSSHQIDYANPDVKTSYYMTTDNFSILERLVDQKAIKGATNLGNMDFHHSRGAEPSTLPTSSTPDPNPKP